MEDIDGASEEQIRQPLSLYEEALVLIPNFVPALTGAAYLAGLLGDVDDARAHLQLALTERPGDADLVEMLASLDTEGEEGDEEEGEDQTTAPAVSAGALIQDGVVSTKFLKVPTESDNQVLLAIFKQLDRDEDGILNTAELHGYHKLVNGTTAPAEVLKFLKENFQWRNGLTPEGFVNFYCSQSVEDLDETFKDLAAFGYNRDLNLQ